MPIAQLARGQVNTLISAGVSGAGAWFAVPLTRTDIGDFMEDFSWQVNVSGGPTFSVQIEGSLDGVNPFIIGAAKTAAGFTSVAATPLAFIRANITSLTGGTSPNVTVLLAYGSQHQ